MALWGWWESGTEEFFAATVPALASGGMTIAILGCLTAALAWRRAVSRRDMLIAAALVLISFFVHAMPPAGVFANQGWNWQGKTFELIWLGVLLALLTRDERRQVGIARPVAGSLRPALLAIAVVFVAQCALVVVALGLGDDSFAHSGTVERLLFDAGHANLVEELLWRGLLLAILDRALGARWRLFGARVGWGLIITSLGFGLIHGLLITQDGLVFAPDQIIMTGVLGAFFCWVRARTGSVWMAYLAHCAPELAIHAGIGVAAIV